MENFILCVVYKQTEKHKWNKKKNLNIDLNTQIQWLSYTPKNTVISSNFLVWKFCGKEQFPHSFWRFARNYAETAPFHKLSTPGY